jgi:division protein CdvB (Snf7/Vps24/ESCRT-III family)
MPAPNEAPAEPLAEHLDQLENVLTAQDNELRRTRTELELRNLYVAELHAVLKRQAEQLEQLAARLQRLEGGGPAAPC